MKLIEDTNQKINKHADVNRYFIEHNIEVIRQRLPVGDYVLSNSKIDDVFSRKLARGIPVKTIDLLGTYSVCVDEKYSILELASDVCGKQHARFRDECILAKNNDIKLYVLVRNDPQEIYVRKRLVATNYTITDLKDLHKWVNPRLWIFQGGKQKYPTATKGVTLMKACLTMKQKYGAEFLFCSTKDAEAKIVELLTS